MIFADFMNRTIMHPSTYFGTIKVNMDRTELVSAPIDSLTNSAAPMDHLSTIPETREIDQIRTQNRALAGEMPPPGFEPARFEASGSREPGVTFKISKSP